MADMLSSLEQTNLNRINNLLGGWIPEFAALGDRELAGAESQQAWIRHVGSVNALFQGIAKRKHPEVQKALIAFKGFVDSVNAKILSARKAAGAAAATFADAEARVAKITAAYADLGALTLPAEQERIEAWVKQAKSQLAYLPRAQAQLAELVAKAPDGARYAVNERFYRVDMPGRLQAMLAEAQRQAAARIEQMEWMLGFVEATDPGEESHVMNRLRGEQVEEKLREIRALAAEARAMESLESDFAGWTPGRLASCAQRLDEAAAAYVRKAEAAVASVRMPEDRCETALAAVAAAKLAEKGFAPARRLVVNYGPQTKASTSTCIEGEWIVTYRVTWEEFQAVTAEAEGEAVHLFYNDFRRYSAGDPATTLGAWLFTGRFQGQRILAEHVAG